MGVGRTVGGVKPRLITLSFCGCLKGRRGKEIKTNGMRCKTKGNVNIYSSATGKTAPGGGDTKWLQHAGTMAEAEKRGTGGQVGVRRNGG